MKKSVRRGCWLFAIYEVSSHFLQCICTSDTTYLHVNKSSWCSSCTAAKSWNQGMFLHPAASDQSLASKLLGIVSFWTVKEEFPAREVWSIVKIYMEAGSTVIHYIWGFPLILCMSQKHTAQSTSSGLCLNLIYSNRGDLWNHFLDLPRP